MKMLWLVVSVLVLHQAVAMKSAEISIKAIIPASLYYKAKLVQCNATAFCPEENTCCRLASGEWGCCPLPDAVCCPDKEHCCPQGETCTSSGTCEGSRITKQVRKQPAIQAKLVQCNETAFCPEENTCCRLASGEWGCCPLPDAVCCPDKEHCCPQGETCTSSGTCEGSRITKQVRKKPAIQAKLVQCNETAFCPEENTCCRLASGEWGCCPLPDAVCCPDKEHCCPQGETCTSSGTCEGSRITKQVRKKPAIQAKLVQCNETAFCPEENTCCRLASGEWGCCPLPDAVCCPDKEHCCPQGETCTSSGTCEGSRTTKQVRKKPAIQAKLVQCNDTAFCADGNTCCRLASGEWGCCPLPDAVCCPDKEHCCPQGETCTSSGTCEGSRITKQVRKKLAIQAKQVQCNATAFCPEGNTCCRLASGEWGCCSYPDAVCCPDKEHCCPHGETCTSSGTCEGSRITKQVRKEPAIQARNVVCKGGEFECPDDYTCCRLASGEWGCCPLPSAVCCPDKKHCCPNGYKCSSVSCFKGSHVIKLFKKTPAVQARNVICPDEQSQCPDGNTCCKLSSGEWGCCPMPNAVCCTDGLHCCPEGYTCDVSEGTCTQITGFGLKQPAREIPKARKPKKVK